MLEKLFHLSEHRTTVKTECIAGCTTFMAMAYIIFVNPHILGDAGVPFQGWFLRRVSVRRSALF